MNDRFFDLSMEKQDRIMNSALKVFSKNMYKHASTDVIIKEAGISKGLLFHYFTNKAGLYSFLYAYCAKYVSMERNTTIPIKETNYFNLLLLMEQANLRASKKYPYIALFLDRARREEDPEIAPFIRSMKEEYEEETNAILSRADSGRFKEALNPLFVETVLFHTLDGIKVQFRENREFTSDELCKALSEYINFFKTEFGSLH